MLKHRQMKPRTGASPTYPPLSPVMEGFLVVLLEDPTQASHVRRLEEGEAHA